MPNMSDLLAGAKKQPDGNEEPQGTATAPQGTATAPQGTATAPQGTATAPQGTATAPQGTATAPQGTATAPQGTATAPQGMNGPVGTNTKGTITDLGKVISSGTEGTIYLQSEEKALKVYNPGYHYNSKILPLVKNLNGKGFLIDLYDFGTKVIQGRNCDFEEMQFCPLGPVSSRKDLKGNADAILKIALHTAVALDACHKAGFIHKDVKPANILIENETTWHCLLCDFGIADMLVDGEVKTQQNRTPIYAAPEMYHPDNCIVKDGATYCRLTPAADFYSLGMTILSMWLGESAFRAQEAELAFQKKEGNIKVPDNMPEPLKTIVQGLLVPEPDDRWALKEIKDKMAGKDVKIVKRMKIVYNSEKKQVAHSLEELAAFMVADPSLAQRYIYTEKLDEWLNQQPELQAKIKEIEKNTQKDHDFGFLQIIHTLNPLYDLALNLPKAAGDPDYAMYDKGIGEVLNKVYYLYFTKYRRDFTSMKQGWDDEDAAMIQSPIIAYQIAKSFESAGDGDYLSWFLNEKNGLFKDKRLANQIDFLKRVKQDKDRDKKNGYKDQSYLSQVKMMQTISGFNAQPTYRIDGTNTLLKSLDDFHAAPEKQLKEALANDKGIRGWLAVMHQENPHEKSVKREKGDHRYDILLEQFVQDLGHCDSNNREYRRFKDAQDSVKDVTATAKSQIRQVYTGSTVQKIFSVALAFVPAALLLISIVLNALDNPVLDMGALSNQWVFYVLGGIFVVASYFLFFIDRVGGCLLSIIVGAVASAIIIMLLKFMGQYLLWIYAAIVFAVIIMFSIVALFKKSPFAMRAKSIMNPSFADLTIDPLNFAFSNETTFKPVNDSLDPQSIDQWRNDVKNRWKTVIIFILIVWGLIACSLLLPKSSRMSQFNRQVKSAALFSNDSIPAEEEELEPIENGDGTTAPFVKPKQRGIIRQ